MNRKSKQCFYFVRVLCFILIAGILPNRASAAETMKIGILTCDLPGGPGIRMAAEMAADEINSQGGILGKQIELVYGDAKNKPLIGAYEYTRLADKEKVVAVLGPASSEVALEVMKQVERYHVPFLVIGASTPKIGEEVALNHEKYRHVFKVFYDSYEIGWFTTDWLVNQLIIPRKMKKAAMVIESAVWTRPLAQAWEKALKDAGAEIVVFEYFDTHSKDFLPIVSRIKESGAETVIVAFAHNDPTEFVQLWADSKGSVLAGVMTLFMSLGKNAGEKSFSTISMAYPGILGLTARDSLFCEKYLLRFKSVPEYTSAYTYDAMYILRDAIEKARNTAAESLTPAMEQTDYEGIIGRWIFDPVSHHPKYGPGYRQFMMVQWQSPGRMCIIWPEEMKNCDLIFPPWYEEQNTEGSRQNPE